MTLKNDFTSQKSQEAQRATTAPFWLAIKYYIIIEVKHLYFMNTLKVLYQKFDLVIQFSVFSFLF